MYSIIGLWMLIIYKVLRELKLFPFLLPCGIQQLDNYGEYKRIFIYKVLESSSQLGDMYPQRIGYVSLPTYRVIESIKVLIGYVSFKLMSHRVS